MSTKISTSVNIAGVELKNPVMTASGTFGSGAEYSEFVDLSKLGAVVTKGVANVPWPGNPTPRVAEVYGGMLNAIGLQNPGIDVFVKRDIPFLKQYDTKIVVNVCGRSTKDYCEVVERLADEPVDLLEINISCPNVKEGGIAFGQNPKSVEDITKEIKRVAKQPVIMKLSPNVTDITETARAAEAGDRRYVRSGGQTGCRAYGISDRTGSKTSDHRHGRHHECRGCPGVHSGRSNCRFCRNRKLYRSDDHPQSSRRDRSIYESTECIRHQRTGRCCAVRR